MSAPLPPIPPPGYRSFWQDAEDGRWVAEVFDGSGVRVMEWMPSDMKWQESLIGGILLNNRREQLLMLSGVSTPKGPHGGYEGMWWDKEAKEWLAYCKNDEGGRVMILKKEGWVVSSDGEDWLWSLVLDYRRKLAGKP